MRDPQRIIRRIGVFVSAGALCAAGLTAPGHADSPSLAVEDGRTQPVFDYAEAVYEEVDIRTEADSDHDGEPDTVRLRLLRPKESDEGLRVSTIIEPSPYWAGGNPILMHEVDLDDESAGTVPRPGQDPPAGAVAGAADPAEPRTLGASAQGERFRGYYDNYFVPRGYAVAQLDSLGSGASTGCPTSGGHNETLGVKAAVDWLAGDAAGWNPDGEEVTADWSNGSAAMTGISYNGTLPTAAATTGVEGLKTIVPQAAISSWYDYYREGGGVRAPGGYQGEDADVLAEYVYTREDDQICRPVIDGITADQDRVTGDYSDFWAERDYMEGVDGIRASVFLVHGQNDWNVMPGQTAQLWKALEEHDVPRKLWLHQGAHINHFPLRMEAWLDQLHAWFDHWLYDLDNGIMDTPAVDIENADLTWSTQESWPAEGTRPVKLHLNAGTDGPAGDLAPRPAAGRNALEGFTDQGRTTAAGDLVADPDAAGESTLVYLTGELSEDVRVAGSPQISVRAAMNGASPYLTALLVDFGTDTRPTGRVRYDLENPVCFDEEAVQGPWCTFRSHHVTEAGDHKIVTRGWLDARNRASLEHQQPVVADRMYHYRWQMQAQDYVFRAGHRIGVVLVSTDHEHTLRYPAGTEVTVDTAASHLTLPVSAGHRSLSGL